MCFVQRIRHRDGQSTPLPIERTAREALGQCFAFYARHEVIGAVLMTHIDGGTDVRMAQRRSFASRSNRSDVSGVRKHASGAAEETSDSVSCPMLSYFARVAPGKRRDTFTIPELRAAFERHTAS
jgi:hypothetical protein